MKKEGTLVATIATATAPVRTDRPELESCTLCGALKKKELKLADKVVNGETIPGKVIRLLTCGSCSRDYGVYCDLAAKAIAADPVNAPNPVSKLAWVLERIDLVRFQSEAETAMADYRNNYNKVVTAVLLQRGYLEGNPTWGPETAPYLRRPQMRFTRAAFQAGTAVTVRENLEGSLSDDHKLILRMFGRVQVATRVKPELQQRLAEAAAKATAEVID